MQKKGYVELSLIPCRKEPAHRSEMVNQLLFGESFTVLDENEHWYYVCADFDGYQSWVEKKQIVLTDISETNGIRQSTLLQTLTHQNTTIKTLRGSVLYNFSKSRTLSNFGKVWKIHEQTEYMAGERNIITTALSYLNTPYLWGGKTPWGIDCSGFTQMVFALNNYKLKRDAYQQAVQGREVELKDILPCDLAFFKNEQGAITHVGIILHDNNIIHASGKVRIDKIDENGIFNVEINAYTHQLAFIRRVI
jgi:cell wall-associated NlpC family hydrolase